MRIKNLLSLLFALPLVFAACEPVDDGVDEPKKEYAAELALTSEATMEFASEGGQGVITYTAELKEVTRETPVPQPEVEATCQADWVELGEPTDERLEFTVSKNEGAARETKVVVTYGDDSFEVAVKQAANEGDEPDPKPEYDVEVKLAAAERYPSSEFGLTDNHFALAFVDDAENIELFLLLVGNEGENILSAGDYASNTGRLLAEECEMFIWEPAAQHTFTEGVATVAVDGDNYTFDIELTNEDALLFHFTYEGVVMNMEPKEKPDPVDFEPTKVCAYAESTWTLGNFELQLYINDSLYHALDMQDMVNPNEDYLSAGHYSRNDGSITSWSNFVANVETGEGAYVTDAEIDIAHNEDGTSTIKGYIESEYGDHLNIDWTGVIEGFNFGSETPSEAVEFAAKFFGGTYYGDGNYYIVLSDVEVTGDKSVEGATYYYFDIYAGVETEDLSVPNGTYTFDLSNSYAAGTFTEESGFGFYISGGVPTWYLYDEGSKITVSENKIVAELVLTDGAKHIVTYEGSTSLAGSSSGGGGVSGDIEINATGWDAIVQYYGQYYNDVTDNYYVELFEDVESGNGGYFALDLLADYATCVDHSGTFTGSESMGINTFVPGYIDGDYLAGSWYAEIEDGVATGTKAPLTEGSVTVTLNGDGTQTYTFDCVDDQGNKVTGSVTATPYSDGYALSKGTEQRSKSFRIELPKRVVR